VKLSPETEVDKEALKDLIRAAYIRIAVAHKV